MNTEKVVPNLVVRNVATLDLRKTAEATLATLKHIENVATVLYSAETAAHVARINVSNVATSIEAPVNAKVLSGQTTFSRNLFQHQSAPLAWIISGQLLVDAALPAEELERGVESLVVSGQLLCPESLAGVVHSKLSHMSGQFVVYPNNAKFVNGKLVLTEAYLRQLPDATTLLVQGKLIAMQPLPADLLNQKLSTLQVHGKVICAEENSDLLRILQNNAGYGEATIIPAGFDLVERSLQLDAGMIETLSSAKLYCTGLVQFEEDVTPEALEGAIERVVANRLLLAPVNLRKTLARKCDLLNTKAIFYTGKLWLVEGEATIDKAWFEALAGEATLVVLGEVQLDPTLDPAQLATHVHQIHNLGEVVGTPAQLATLQARVGLNEGEWADIPTKADEPVHENVIGNIAYLEL